MNNIIELTKKLISIPSWVDGQTNEIKVSNFIFEFLQNNCDLILEKETVIDNRFNILVGFNQSVKTLVIGHMDTVGVSDSWLTNPLTPTIKDGKLFGRGATDMKSGLAAMMLVANQKKLPRGTAFLFYIDEEYDFAGIKKFITDYGSKISPSAIVSLDGSDLNIANGCRGLIEISASIKGISCHASTPENGINAIEVATRSVEKLKVFLAQFEDQELGKTSLNLASIKSWGNASNVVPDNCQFTLDIRPSTPVINAQLVVNRLNQFVTELNGTIADIDVKFDFGSWLTPQTKLAKLGHNFKNIDTSGYIDVQMLWQIFNKPNCLTIGAGVQATAHTSNEYIQIDKLKKLEPVLFDIIQKI